MSSEPRVPEPIYPPLGIRTRFRATPEPILGQYRAESSPKFPPPAVLFYQLSNKSTSQESHGPIFPAYKEVIICLLSSSKSILFSYCLHIFF
jgi:hypothetical protein